MNGASYFSQAAAALGSGSALLNAHRSDIGKLTVALVVRITNGDSSVRVLCGTARVSSGSDTGYSVSISANGILQLGLRNGTTQSLCLQNT